MRGLQALAHGALFALFVFAGALGVIGGALLVLHFPVIALGSAMVGLGAGVARYVRTRPELDPRTLAKLADIYARRAAAEAAQPTRLCAMCGAVLGSHSACQRCSEWRETVAPFDPPSVVEDSPPDVDPDRGATEP